MWGSGPAFPVVGDWNGDGNTSVGRYEPGTPRFVLNNFVPPAGESKIQLYGAAGTLPVVGDWNGDGTDETGYFEVDDRVFHRRGTSNIVFTEEILANFNTLQGTTSGLYPLAGEWDVDGELEPPPYPWSSGNPAEHGFDAEALQGAVSAAGNLAHLNSLVVVRHDLIMAEAYFNGYRATIANHMMSATKSVLSALYGVAVRDGYISGNPAAPIDLLASYPMEELLDAPLPIAYPVCGGGQINLLRMMTMTSGFTQGNPLPLALFNSSDWVEWIVSGPDDPGCDLCDPTCWWTPGKLGEFDYYGGNNHAGAEILRRFVASNYDDVYEFSVDRLFERLQIRPTRWDHEPASNVLPAALGEKVIYGPSQMFMRPRDMARFGHLFLEGGVIGSDVILDSQWVFATTQDLVSGPTGYGCWWWREYLNGNPICFHDHCGYLALGFGGQQIYVFPSLDMLVVMTSHWINVNSGSQISANEGILQQVLESLNFE